MKQMTPEVNVSGDLFFLPCSKKRHSTKTIKTKMSDSRLHVVVEINDIHSDS